MLIVQCQLKQVIRCFFVFRTGSRRRQDRLGSATGLARVGDRTDSCRQLELTRNLNQSEPEPLEFEPKLEPAELEPTAVRTKPHLLVRHHEIENL